MSLIIFDIELGSQGMKDISELWHCLVYFMSQCGPSCIQVIITSNRVVLCNKHNNIQLYYENM
jgi:hypothetical protein